MYGRTMSVSLGLVCLLGVCAPASAFDVLVFSKTAGFRHDSIPAGITAVQALGSANGFGVTATEDAGKFTDAFLDDFDAVLFLNTTGDVLNDTQQGAFQRFIQDGGGFVGIHSAADTEHDWPWYAGLVGALFKDHPAIQSATIQVADRVHPSTAHLPARWHRSDEWYNYKTNPRGSVHVLATLDEKTYTGGNMGFDHPTAWCHEYDGGRAWYTGGGHTSSSFSEPAFLEHLLGGIRFAAGDVAGDCGATVESEFRRVVLDDDIRNPMSLDVANDGRVFFIQRSGEIKIYNPASQQTVTALSMSVYVGHESGGLGIALDPNFDANQWLYVMYSPPDPASEHRVSRFTVNGDTINSNSEVVLLRIPMQRAECCHQAGSLAFDPDGNLLISTGDNVNPFASDGYAPIDERPGRAAWDAQGTAGNTNDLRGKILRITPQPAGPYTIPTGNLFTSPAEGKPEIYVMGCRNPFRMTVDPATGWVYFGDVGPDANSENPQRGVRGYDEFNRVTSAGNFGWPFCIGNNHEYNDYNFATQTSSGLFNCAAPNNDSPNNTGANTPPASKPPLIWYPYSTTNLFPELGGGGRTGCAGPLYRFDPYSASTIKFPPYYDGTLFVFDFSRHWIQTVKFDDSNGVLKIDSFLPNLSLKRPIELEAGPDGALYLLEYGDGGQDGAQLSRIEYLGEPIIVIDGPDFDNDGDIDQTDYGYFQRCYTGPGVPQHDPACQGIRFDADNDVDLDDFGVFQSCISGPNIPATPECLQ